MHNVYEGQDCIAHCIAHKMRFYLPKLRVSYWKCQKSLQISHTHTHTHTLSLSLSLSSLSLSLSLSHSHTHTHTHTPLQAVDILQECPQYTAAGALYLEYCITSVCFPCSEATVSPPIAKPRRNSKVKFYPKTEEREATQSPDVSRPSRTTPMNVRYHGDIHVLVLIVMLGIRY